LLGRLLGEGFLGKVLLGKGLVREGLSGRSWGRASSSVSRMTFEVIVVSSCFDDLDLRYVTGFTTREGLRRIQNSSSIVRLRDPPTVPPTIFRIFAP
jgi:hypothetical protein